MANLDKQSQEVLKATMEYIENTIRDLSNRQSPLSLEDQQKLINFKAIRVDILKLKQKNLTDFYLFPNRTRDEINDLTSKVNDLIAKNSADIQQIFNGNNPTLLYPDTIEFKVSKLTPHDAMADDSLALGFLMRSYCSKEPVLPTKKPEPTMLDKLGAYLPGMPQPRPGMGKYVAAAVVCSTVSILAPPLGMLLTAGTVYAYNKDSNNQPQTRGTVARITESASVEHIKNTRVSLGDAIKQKSGIKPLSPAQQQQQKQQQQPNASPPSPGSKPAP